MHYKIKVYSNYKKHVFIHLLFKNIIIATINTVFDLMLIKGHV